MNRTREFEGTQLPTAVMSLSCLLVATCMEIDVVAYRLYLVTLKGIGGRLGIFY